MYSIMAILILTVVKYMIVEALIEVSDKVNLEEIYTLTYDCELLVIDRADN